VSHNRHHYLPAAFLAAWERAPGPKLTHFSKPNGTVVAGRCAAKSAARELGLYAYELAPPEQRNALETGALQRIDNDGAVMHRALLERPGAQLTDEQGSAWIRFVASLMLRTPKHLRRWRTFAPGALREIVEENEEDTEFHRFASRYIEQGGPKLESRVTIDAFAHLLEDSAAHQALARSHWFIRDISRAGTDLVISDDPVLRGGPFDADYLIALPISPTKIFFATNSKAVRAQAARLTDADVVLWANRDSAAQSDRYLYATGPHHGRLARRCLGQGWLGRAHLARLAGISEA